MLGELSGDIGSLSLPISIDIFLFMYIHICMFIHIFIFRFILEFVEISVFRFLLGAWPCQGRSLAGDLCHEASEGQKGPRVYWVAVKELQLNRKPWVPFEGLL